MDFLNFSKIFVSTREAIFFIEVWVCDQQGGNRPADQTYHNSDLGAISEFLELLRCCYIFFEQDKCYVCKFEMHQNKPFLYKANNLTCNTSVKDNYYNDKT